MSPQTPPTWTGPALVATAMLGLALSLGAFVAIPLSKLPLYFMDRIFVLDATSILFVMVINLVFLGITVYMSSRVNTSQRLARQMNSRSALSLAFMVVINLGILSNNLLMIWIFVELSTLCATPLVAQGDAANPHRVAWTYLMYSSISLGLCFLGFMCLTHSAHLHGLELNFQLDVMAATLPQATDAWQTLGLSMIMLGLGAKLGLVPLYSWLPVTYESSPTSTSALLAAVQFNIGTVAVFRILQVFRLHDLSFISYQLLIMGCVTLVIAAVQIMATHNYKRLVAYACLSSSGVIAIGLSVGRDAAYGVLLYIVSNAFVKALLFLTAGRLRSVYQTNDVKALSGVIRVMPFSGMLFAMGTFALLGFPPFGSFLAEMLILSGIVQSGNLLAFTLMCSMLTIIFVATGRTVFPMLWGPTDGGRARRHETVLTALPKVGFVAILVLLGAYTPAAISDLLQLVAFSIGGQ